jgi:adenosylcobinamide-GDP ribazoletransferase
VQPSWIDRIKALLPTCRQEVSCFLAAFRFLTIIPVRWRAEKDGEYFPRSLPYFPLLGGLIGISVGTLSLLLRSFLPGSVVTVVVLILLAVVSGCLHLDGLADTADGFLSSRPKERILEIMRDSRTGAMGVIIIVLVLLLKFAALSSLPEAVFFKTVCLMPIAGRCAIIFSMAILPYARQEGGLGNLFYSEGCRKSAIWSLVFLLALVPFIGIWTLFLVCLILCTVVLLFSAWCNRKIGGATGDTLGAVCEITEMAVAVGMANTFVLS